MRKSFVIDTNIILNDYSSLLTFKDVDLYLPQVVLQELDSKKTEYKTIGYNARSAIRLFKKLMKEQNTYENLQLANGTTLTLIPTKPKELNITLKKLGLEPTADNIIIAFTHQLKLQGHDVTLITQDSNMWITAMSYDLVVEDYSSDKKQRSTLYSGVKVLMIDDIELINKVYAGEDIYLDEIKYPNLYPNQILVIKVEGLSSLIARFLGYNKPIKRCTDKKRMNFSGIKPLNKEQAMAFELLTDKSLPCVTLAGRAGTGKSIVALSYGLHSLEKRFQKIMVLKPIVPVGQDLGYLPGDLNEKLLPWTKSFMDSLDVIFSTEENYSKDGFNTGKPYEYLIQSGQLEFQPLTFMRGRSIQNTLIIIDEAQNISKNEMKTLITRVGEGSQLICLGDIDQIDSPYLDKQNNGLTHLIERGKESELIGHITFIKSHRSELSDWAGEYL